MNNNSFERRRFIKNSALGLFGITAFGYASANDTLHKSIYRNYGDPVSPRYPAISDELASGIVGASHGNFDRVKELVNRRPELAGAAWDWGFGDYETALGAASHVGRRDIAEFLMSHGARPDIFTFAMLGMLQSVQEIIQTVPGIQSHTGPHGITLLQHAKNRLEDKKISEADRDNVNKVISYLQSLGNADVKPANQDMAEAEKLPYIGEYRFGEKDDEIFVVNLHRLNFLQLGRKGLSARKLNKTGEHQFSPAGAASVKIIFKMKDDKAISLSIHEPEPLVTGIRI